MCTVCTERNAWSKRLTAIIFSGSHHLRVVCSFVATQRARRKKSPIKLCLCIQMAPKKDQRRQFHKAFPLLCCVFRCMLVWNGISIVPLLTIPCGAIHPILQNLTQKVSEECTVLKPKGYEKLQLNWKSTNSIATRIKSSCAAIRVYVPGHKNKLNVHGMQESRSLYTYHEMYPE